MTNPTYLAISLNPSESHAVMGTLDSEKNLVVTDICEFRVRLVYLNGLYYWDIYDLFEQIKRTIKLAMHKTGAPPDYLALDCWAHDFGLFDERDEMIDLPMSYRNFTSDQYMNEVFGIIPPKEIYRVTGNNFNTFNSIFQLYYLKKEKPGVLARTRRLMFLPDILNYLLTGQSASETTYAVTTQAFNISTHEWQAEFFEALGLDVSIMPAVEKPGRVLGSLKKEILDELELSDLKVILGATTDHSTALASFAEEGQNWAVIFSRSWMLMGIQLNDPVLSSQAMRMSFTNSVSYIDKYFFQKAAYGLGVLENCKNIWLDDTNFLTGENISFPTPSFKYLLNIRNMELLTPGNVFNSINALFRRYSQPPPATREQTIQCIYESLAFMSRFILDQIKHFAPEFIERIYMGNDGAENKYLCQCVANATGTSIYAGNRHSSAVGNVIIQMLTVGDIANMAEARKIIDASIGYQIFEPREARKWDEVYLTKFLNLMT